MNEIDLVEITFTLFWLFFIGMIIYIRREDKREGYPLDSDRSARSNRMAVRGFPAQDGKKAFTTAHGDAVSVPRADPDRDLAAQPVAVWPGAPLRPTGNPMRDGVGPAAWSDRADVPDTTLHGDPRIVPMRLHPEFQVADQDPDPRGMLVLAGDKKVAGEVVDLWIDLAEPMIMYFEVKVYKEYSPDERHAMLPIGFSVIEGGQRAIHVQSIYAAQFAHVPALKHPDQITLLEEDKITGYFAGGKLYADPRRQESVI